VLSSDRRRSFLPVSADYHWSQEGDENTKAFFFPRNSASSATGEGDPVWEIFDEIDCGVGSTLHVGHARWSWARRGIAHKAAALQQAGCSVHVVVSPNYTTPELVAILTNAGVSVTLYPLVHSKYWLLDGVFQGQQGHFVWTGSQNFTSTGLRSNDEAFVQIADPDLYEGYLENWHIMQTHPEAG
jgi:hypothetical protein